MSRDDAAAAAGMQTLTTTDAHAAGTVSAVWLNPKEPGQLSVLTAGADGVLAEQQIRPTKDVKWKTTICKDRGVPVNALAVSPDGKMAAVVINHTHVKVTNRHLHHQQQQHQPTTQSQRSWQIIWQAKRSCRRHTCSSASVAAAVT